MQRLHIKTRAFVESDVEHTIILDGLTVEEKALACRMADAMASDNWIDEAEPPFFEVFGYTKHGESWFQLMTEQEVRDLLKNTGLEPETEKQKRVLSDYFLSHKDYFIWEDSDCGYTLKRVMECPTVTGNSTVSELTPKTNAEEQAIAYARSVTSDERLQSDLVHAFLAGVHTALRKL